MCSLLRSVASLWLTHAAPGAWRPLQLHRTLGWGRPTSGPAWSLPILCSRGAGSLVTLSDKRPRTPGRCFPFSVCFMWGALRSVLTVWGSVCLHGYPQGILPSLSLYARPRLWKLRSPELALLSSVPAVTLS